MGFFDRFSGQPRWASALPEQISPSPSAIAQLEILRQELRLGHQELAAYIAGHSSTTAKVLQHAADTVRQQTPGLSDEDALRLVLKQRVTLLLQAGRISLLGLTV